MIGVVIDGCPAGLEVDLEFVQKRLDLRKPGQSHLTTQRKESDRAEIVSGVFEGQTTGTPLTALIRNEDSRSKDYAAMVEKFRPSHADYTYFAKYGLRDHRGGGRSSARETAARVFAGAIAEMLLKKSGVEIRAYVSQVGAVRCEKDYRELDLARTEQSLVRCPDDEAAEKMTALIEEVRRNGDSVGGVITGVVRGCPVGLGEPVFDRLHSDLGKAMLSINAVKGFEIGSGFQGATMRGSEHNDPFAIANGAVVTTTNRSGGIQGGISNGMDIYFRVAFKPVATIMKKQKTVDQSGQETEIEGRGRHDPCVLPRAVSIVEAMTAITLADHLLRARAARA
jgi:chorismate synthase